MEPLQKLITPLEEAFEAALKMAGMEYAVVATGSLFVAAAAREVWTEIQLNYQDIDNSTGNIGKYI